MRLGLALSTTSLLAVAVGAGPPPSVPIIDDVGTISGTRGNGNTLTGTTAHAIGVPFPVLAYQWQVFTAGAWTNIGGATGLNYTDTALTENAPIRRRVTATNSQGSDVEVSNTLAGLSGGGIPDDELVALNNQAWLDTVATGGVVSTITEYQTGAPYTARLIAQQGWAQPPSDALEIVGGEVRARASYANIYPSTYLCEIVNTNTNFTTHQLVDVLSNKVATHTATPGTFDTVVSNIISQINSQLAGFTGAIVDLQPGPYGERSIDLPKVGQTRPVVFRTADPNRTDPANRASFEAIKTENSRYIGFQGIEWRIGPAQNNKFLLASDRVSAPFRTTEFLWVSRCRMLGGDYTFNGDGTAFLDGSKLVDPANNYHPTYSYFKGAWNGTTFTGLDLYVGHLDIEESGARDPNTNQRLLGVWKQATVPAFVGQNTPTGQAGIFTKQHFNPRVRPVNATSATPDVAIPPNFDAEFEVAYLDSTPRNTVFGGNNRTKPGPDPISGAPAPDGNYIVAWRLNDGGSPWTNADTSQTGHSNMRWVGYRSLWSLPIFMQGEGSNQFRNVIIHNNDMRSVLDGVKLNFIDTSSAHWVAGNYYDGYFRDSNQFFWFTGTTAGSIRVWNPDSGLLFAFNFSHRPLGLASMWLSPHNDSDQHASDNDDPPGGTPINDFPAIQPLIVRLGNTLSVRGGRVNAFCQGPFMSDSFRYSSGYRSVGGGNFVDAAGSNGHKVDHLAIEYACYDTVLTQRYNADMVPAQPGNPLFPAGIWLHKVLTGTRGGMDLAAGQNVRDEVFGLGSSAFANYDLSFAPDLATLEARFAAVGAATGYGAFAGAKRHINRIRRTWNPNMWEFHLLQPEKSGQPLNTLVPGVPRQLLWGTFPYAVSTSGGFWTKGATFSAALAATPTNNPGTISKGEWFVPWVQSSAVGETVTSGTFTINGVVSTFSVRTAALGFNFPANGVAGNITRVPLHISPAASATVWNVLSSYPIPDGAMALFVTGNDGGQNPAASGNVAWVDHGHTALSTTASISVFSWFNDTGATVNANLTLTWAAAEQGSGVLYIIPRSVAGRRIIPTVQRATRSPAATSHDGITVDPAVTRKYLAIQAFVLDGTAITVASAPTGYTNLTASPAANTGSVSTTAAERFVEAASEDPLSWTLSASAAGLAAGILLHEAPL